MQRLELAQSRLHRLSHEVALHQLGVLTIGGSEIGEDHALGGDLRIESRQDRGGVPLHDDSSVGTKGDLCGRILDSGLFQGLEGSDAGIVETGRWAQAIELQTTQVGAAPLLIAPCWHRERLIQLPGPYSRVATGAGFDARPRDGFDALTREPALLRLHSQVADFSDSSHGYVISIR